MMECGGEVGAVLGQLGMGNLREARAEYAIEGARVEQGRPSSELSEVGSGVCRVSVRLIGADATGAGRSSFCLG
jgi:hypothetical protein